MLCLNIPATLSWCEGKDRDLNGRLSWLTMLTTATIKTKIIGCFMKQTVFTKTTARRKTSGTRTAR